MKVTPAHALNPGDVISTPAGNEIVQSICVLPAPAGPITSVFTDRTVGRLPHLMRTALLVTTEETR